MYIYIYIWKYINQLRKIYVKIVKRYSKCNHELRVKINVIDKLRLLKVIILGVGASWPPLTTFISETMRVRSTLVDKCWQEIS